jgi:phosphoribosylanthranilate isomerase
MTTDMSVTRIKICGITNESDAETCLAHGADAIGFMFADSPRRVSVECARDILRSCGPFATAVGVFVDSAIDEVRRTLDVTGCALAQLHGSESAQFIEALSPSRVVKAIRIGSDQGRVCESFRTARAILLDTYVPGRAGGTGKRFHPSVAAALVSDGWRVIVAGGLTPENVGEVVQTVRPYGVDVSSGVESAPGRKDHTRVKDFVAAVRAVQR